MLVKLRCPAAGWSWLTIWCGCVSLMLFVWLKSASPWRKDFSRLLKLPKSVREKQRNKKQEEMRSSTVSSFCKEEGMFLCHYFPSSWQREESQGRACQCESSLKVWRLQLDIASGLTPKDKDNAHPSVKMCQTTHSANTYTHANTKHTHTTCLHVPVLHEMHVDTTAVCTPSIISSRQQAELLTSKICHALLVQ